MAEMTIRLRCDPQTGKKDIIVSLKSDEDALPMEHEQQHKALVDKLLEKGIVKATELGEVIVEREQPESEGGSAASDAPQEERQSISQGN